MSTWAVSVCISVGCGVVVAASIYAAYFAYWRGVDRGSSTAFHARVIHAGRWYDSLIQPLSVKDFCECLDQSPEFTRLKASDPYVVYGHIGGQRVILRLDLLTDGETADMKARALADIVNATGKQREDVIAAIGCMKGVE